MSDGGISMASAFGYDSNELRRTVLVRPKWLKDLREARLNLMSQARYHILRQTDQNAAPPDLPEDLTPLIKSIADGERNVFGKWFFPQDSVIEAIHDFNVAVDRAWNFGLGFGDGEPRKAESRRKAGYTKRLTPAQWLKVRGEMVKIQIAQSAYTLPMWKDEVQTFMDFLTEGKLPNGVIMDANKPNLTHQVAGNILWFLQEVLGWVGADEVDICSDCGSVILTDRETHDWCPECGKMRCDCCTTAPHYCQCDSPCSEHCTCKEDER